MNSTRESRRSVTAGHCLGTALACALTVLSFTGACSPNECNPSSATVGSVATPLGNWRIVGDCSTGPDCELVWLSSPTIGAWLPFPGGRTYTLVFPPLPALSPGLSADFSTVFPPQAWVAAVPPDEPDANFTQTSGQLAEFGNISSSSISVTNASCADYSLLVEVTVPVIATADAGSSTD
jgi:hypothetical protein